MDQQTEIGYIRKTHGYKGHVRMIVYDDLQIDLANATALFIDQKGEILPHFISEHKQTMDNEFLVLLEDFTSKEVAALYKGAKIYLPSQFVTTTNNVNEDSHELIGYAVEDIENGAIGTVKEIYDMPQQELLAIDYGKKEVLIPLRLELIHKMDKQNRKIVFKLPAGFLEI